MGRKIGPLRHRIVIRRPTEVSNGKGGFTVTTPELARAWAAIEGLAGTEVMAEQALEGVSAYRITIRWRVGVRQSDQVVLSSGDVMNIKSATDVAGDRRWLTILADDGAVKTAA